LLNKLFQDFVFYILSLVESNASDGSGALVDGLLQTIIDIRKQARANKDWATSDKIRDELAKLHITLKDGKEGTSWVVD
jgi:cysteinyl-tRNA synthetase